MFPHCGGHPGPPLHTGGHPEVLIFLQKEDIFKEERKVLC